MKKLLFAISITLFSLLGLHAYAADNAATTHELKSNQMRSALITEIYPQIYGYHYKFYVY